MDKLFEGARQFSRQGYEKHKSLFMQLNNRQNPHTLFITCSDSRIVPALITQSLPGELFVIRNVANIVPPAYLSDRFAENLSAIEYAVQVLGVDQAVICGHSNCGGCRALFSGPAGLSILPYTSRWLELARPAKERAETRQDPPAKDNLHRLVEQENILLQMENMGSHPFIHDRQKSGSLRIYGWYYDIGRGEILNYNPHTGKFERIE